MGMRTKSWTKKMKKKVSHVFIREEKAVALYYKYGKRINAVIRAWLS